MYQSTTISSTTMHRVSLAASSISSSSSIVTSSSSSSSALLSSSPFRPLTTENISPAKKQKTHTHQSISSYHGAGDDTNAANAADTFSPHEVESLTVAFTQACSCRTVGPDCCHLNKETIQTALKLSAGGHVTNDQHPRPAATSTLSASSSPYASPQHTASSSPCHCIPLTSPTFSHKRRYDETAAQWPASAKSSSSAGSSTTTPSRPIIRVRHSQHLQLSSPHMSPGSSSASSPISNRAPYYTPSTTRATNGDDEDDRDQLIDVDDDDDDDADDRTTARMDSPLHSSSYHLTAADFTQSPSIHSISSPMIPFVSTSDSANSSFQLSHLPSSVIDSSSTNASISSNPYDDTDLPDATQTALFADVAAIEDRENESELSFMLKRMHSTQTKQKEEFMPYIL